MQHILRKNAKDKKDRGETLNNFIRGKRQMSQESNRLLKPKTAKLRVTKKDRLKCALDIGTTDQGHSGHK